MDLNCDFLNLRKCLGLIEDSPTSIQHELDLIGALSILSDFDVNILPVQGNSIFTFLTLSSVVLIK